MIKLERQEQLESLINARGFLSVNDAISLLNSSPMTVRRDMDELASENKLERVRGGGKSLHPIRNAALEQPHNTKRQQHINEKHRIAQLAAELIEHGDTVFIGAGTTCELIGSYLAGTSARVVTNSLPAFDLVKDVAGIETILLGGLYRPKTSIFYGPLTANALNNINFDKVFVGANGIDGSDVTGHNADISDLQRIAFDCGKKRYILADSSKFGRRDFITFYDMRNIDALITDNNITPEYLAEYSAYTRVIS